MLKYSEIWENPAGQYYQNKKMEVFLSFLLEGTILPRRSVTILDVGCADGVNTRKFAKLGYTMVGFDRSVKYLRDAKKATLKDGSKCSFLIDYIRGDAENLPFRRGSFNNTMSMAVFQYLNRLKALREIIRVTRSTGMVILDISNRFCLYYLGLNRIIHFLFPRIPTYSGSSDKSSRPEMRSLFRYLGLVEMEIKPILLVHWELPDRLFRFAKWVDRLFEKSPLIRDLMGVIVCKGVVSTA